MEQKLSGMTAPHRKLLSFRHPKPTRYQLSEPRNRGPATAAA
jgi:hypothetical protein